jgi:hypothetical protein
VRTWFTLLALTCFLPQQFTCCVQQCGTCVDSTAAHVAESPCEHHHDHHHDVPLPLSDHSPHHLCVATHLFYLAPGNAGALRFDLNVGEVVLPTFVEVVDLQGNTRSGVIASLSVPSPDPQRLRAVLGVWVV